MVDIFSRLTLRDLNNRLQSEKQYKQLSPGSYEKAISFVKKATATLGAVAALYALSKTPLSKDIKDLLDKGKSFINGKLMDRAYRIAMGG